jgi:hypothetical protein
MSARIRSCLLLGLALVSCSSSSANDGRGSGGSSGGSGDSGSTGGAGGNAGSTSGGASGASGASGACAGTANECITCCSTKLPAGYAEFLDEFEISQCGVEACAGTCQDICSGAGPTWSQSCAECLWTPNPTVPTSVKLACKVSAKDACQEFAACLETCQLD